MVHRLAVLRLMVILSVQNARENPLATRAPPRTRWGELAVLPYIPPSWWDGVGCPSPRAPHPLSALQASNFGPSGLAPCLPKSVYQNPTCGELNLYPLPLYNPLYNVIL